MIKLLTFTLSLIVLCSHAFAACPTVTMGTKPHGYVFYNSDYGALQICSQNVWKALGAINCPSGNGCDPCAESPTPGTTCADGSIYAGLSPDGNVAMYTTSADAPSLIAWNDGSSNWVDTAMANCTDGTPGTASSCQTGEANTALLVGLSGSGTPAPYDAAEYCDGLSAHGYDDWYLPAQDELNVLYTNKNTGDLNGTFNETGSFYVGYYWSSSENRFNAARYQRFSDGLQSNSFKTSGYAVRCVRK